VVCMVALMFGYQENHIWSWERECIL
jgi:hypothetical protein